MMKPHCIVCKAALEPLLSKGRDWEYGVQGEFSFMRCEICGILVLFPTPSLEQLKMAYPASYHGFNTGSSGIMGQLYRFLFRLRVVEYARLAGQNGKILDVGCADAPYFDTMKKYYPAIEIMGVEFKDDVALIGRQKGRKIVTGTIEDIPGQERFDLVVMNNLIEHVINPSEELCNAWRLLKPEGYIVIETPNAGSCECVFLGKYWGGLHIPRHTYLFSVRALAALALQEGFALRKCSYLLNTDHLALSVQNLCQDIPALRTSLVKGRSWYYPLLIFAFIPLNLLLVILRRTGAFTMMLHKMPMKERLL